MMVMLGYKEILSDEFWSEFNKDMLEMMKATSVQNEISWRGQ